MPPETLMKYDKVASLVTSITEADDALTKARTSLSKASGDRNAPGMFYAPSWMNVAEPTAFGDTPAAGGLATLYRVAKQAGDAAADHLRGVLGEDVTRLREVIETFKRLDQRQADEICAMAARQELSVYSTHVHSDGSEPIAEGPIWARKTPDIDDATANEYVRAAQIEKFQKIFNENPGLVGGDFNVEADKGGRSAESLKNFGGDGHNIDAGRLNDGIGGTSGSNRHIDYVITASGITAQNPQRVDGGSSDHDGQRVDVTVPRW